MIEASLFLIMKFDEILLERANKKVALGLVCLLESSFFLESEFRESKFRESIFRYLVV